MRNFAHWTADRSFKEHPNYRYKFISDPKYDITYTTPISTLLLLDLHHIFKINPFYECYSVRYFLEVSVTERQIFGPTNGHDIHIRCSVLICTERSQMYNLFQIRNQCERTLTKFGTRGLGPRLPTFETAPRTQLPPHLTRSSNLPQPHVTLRSDSLVY